MQAVITAVITLFHDFQLQLWVHKIFVKWVYVVLISTDDGDQGPSFLSMSIFFYWLKHDDVIKWKHFPRYWPFLRGSHRSPVNSPHIKGHWRWALVFSLICAWTNGWTNNRDTGDSRRHCTHYDATVMDHAQPYWDRNRCRVRRLTLRKPRFNVRNNIEAWYFGEKKSNTFQWQTFFSFVSVLISVCIHVSNWQVIR